MRKLTAVHEDYMNLILLSRDRNSHAKCRSFRRLTLGLNFAAVRLGDPFADRETQTDAAVLARARSIRAIKTIENVGHIFRGDPDPTVPNFSRREAVFRPELHVDSSASGRIFHGVIEQDHEQPFDRVRIRLYPKRTGRAVSAKRQPFLRREQLRLFARLSNNGAYIRTVHAQVRGAGIRACQRQQVFDQLRDFVGLMQNLR